MTIYDVLAALYKDDQPHEGRLLTAEEIELREKLSVQVARAVVDAIPATRH